MNNKADYILDKLTAYIHLTMFRATDSKQGKGQVKSNHKYVCPTTALKNHINRPTVIQSWKSIKFPMLILILILYVELKLFKEDLFMSKYVII